MEQLRKEVASSQGSWAPRLSEVGEQPVTAQHVGRRRPPGVPGGDTRGTL